MSAFPNWQQFAVRQRRPQTGCIPAGYEMILRAARISDVDFAAFQDDFDLDKSKRPEEPTENGFETVAAAVRKRYPSVLFKHKGFGAGEGLAKVAFIEQHVAQSRPILVRRYAVGNLGGLRSGPPGPMVRA